MAVIECQYCSEYKTDTHSKLKNHIRSEHGDIARRCIFCDTVFNKRAPYSTLYNMHYQRKHSSQPLAPIFINSIKSGYKCLECDVIFSSGIALHVHRTVVHENKGKKKTTSKKRCCKKRTVR